MRERLAYLHFPKAAGTSVRSALQAHYGSEVTCPWTLHPDLFAPFEGLERIDAPVFLGDPEELRHYRCLEGHWSLPDVLGGFEAADVACVLRDARARLLSHHACWRSWPDRQHEMWAHYDVSRLARRRLDEFLTHPRCPRPTTS